SGFAHLVGYLLLILTRPACGLVNVFFKIADVIGQGFLAFAEAAFGFLRRLIILIAVLLLLAGQLLDILLDLLLARSRVSSALFQILRGLPAARTLQLIHAAPGLFNLFQRPQVLGNSLLLVLVLTCRLSALHFVSRLIQLTAEVLQLLVAAFARQPFEFARGLARLINQFLLLASASAPAALIARALLPALLLFEFLLLAAGQLFQLAFGLVVLLLALLLLFAFERLVLVLHLVEFQFEQIRQLFGV